MSTSPISRARRRRDPGWPQVRATRRWPWNRPRKRKREANPIVRIIGIIFFGLLAVPCTFGIAMYAGVKLDFLPPWLQFFNSNKPGVRADMTKPVGQSNTPVNGQAVAANTNSATANPAASNPDAGQANQAPGTGQNPATKSDPAKEDTKPVTPPATKPADADIGDTKPEDKPELKPAGAAPAKPDTAAKPDADPFGPAPEVAPVNEKNKPDTKPAIKPDTKPDAKPEVKPDVKPDVATPDKPDTAAKPDADPFGPAPEVAPVNEKNKPEVKPDSKPDTKPDSKPDTKPDSKPDTKPDSKPDTKPGVKPDVAAPGKTEPEANADADPFGPARRLLP